MTKNTVAVAKIMLLFCLSSQNIWSQVSYASVEHQAGVEIGRITYSSAKSRYLDTKIFNNSNLTYRFRFSPVEGENPNWAVSLGLGYEPTLVQIVKEEYELLYQLNISGDLPSISYRNEVFSIISRYEKGTFLRFRFGMHRYSIALMQEGFDDIKAGKMQLSTEIEWKSYQIFGGNWGLGVFFEIFSIPMSIDRIDTQYLGIFFSFSTASG